MAWKCLNFVGLYEPALEENSAASAEGSKGYNLLQRN